MGNMPYKVKDSEENVFVFSGYESGFPTYRGTGGSKHIYETEIPYYTIIEMNAPKN